MSDTNVQFRRGLESDATQISELCLTQTPEHEIPSPATLKDGIKSMLQDPHKGRVFVVESNKKILAAAFIFMEWSEWRNHPMWWIQKVCISPELDQPDHLQKFFSKIRSYALEEGAETIRVIEAPGNESMVQIGIKNGMESHYRIFEELLTDLPN